MKKKSIRELNDRIDLSEALTLDKIDENAGIIKDVVLMTGNKVSKNRTLYKRTALEQAVTRYDGAKMFLDHPTKEELANRRGVRSVRDLAGVYRNIRISEGEQPKLLGDLHLMSYNKDIALSIAKNPPKDTGLSLRDTGMVKQDKGVTVVESFDGDEFSVDFVVTASLNKGLFESKQTEGGEEYMDLTKLTLEELEESRKDLVEAIEKRLKDAYTKELAEAGVKSTEAQKIIVLAESGMSKEFKDAIKAAITKPEVTLEEAQKIISNQAELFKNVEASRTPKGSDQDPKVNTGPARKTVQEGVKDITDEQILDIIHA